MTRPPRLRRANAGERDLESGADKPSERRPSHLTWCGEGSRAPTGLFSQTIRFDAGAGLTSVTLIVESETCMTGPTPYLKLDGTARPALEFYAETFGGSAELHTFGELGRDDGPPDFIAHGHLLTPHLSLYAADVGTGEDHFVPRGIMLSLLGTAGAPTLRAWFGRLSQDGSTVQPLQERPWGDSDGQVIDRFGVHWLIGYTAETPD